MFARRTTALALLLFSLAACAGTSKEELIARGETELRRGNPGGAVVFFKNALERGAGDFPARRLLAKAYLAGGSYDQAEREYLRLLREAPSRPEVTLELATLYVATGKGDAAIGLVEEHIRRHGAGAATSELLGSAWAVKKQPAEAERCLREALAAEPASVPVKLELAALYRQFGIRADEARRLLAEVLAAEPDNLKACRLQAELEVAAGANDRALALYRRIARRDPADVAARYQAGLLLVAAERLDEAAAVADGLCRDFPRRAQGFCLTGIVDYCRHNYAEAIPALQRSLAAGPAPEARYYLALALLDKGELENALSELRAIAAGGPFARQARYLLAATLLKQQRIDDAVDEFGRLLADDPGNARAHNALASALLLKGRYPEALREIDRAVALDPAIVDAHLKKGLYLMRSGKAREAEAEFAGAVRAAPDELRSRLVLASFHLRQKRFDQALAVLREGLRSGRGDAPLYNSMAAVAFARGGEQEAVDFLLKAKGADPSFLAAPFNLATLYAAAGKPAQALAEYDQVLARLPGHPQALLNKGALLELAGRDEEAARCYLEALRSQTPAAYLAQARYQMRKKQQGEALATLKRGLEALPGNPAVLAMKKEILLAGRQYGKALELCDDIACRDAEQGLKDKVGCLLAMGDYGRALEQARRYVALHPKSATGYLALAAIHERRGELAQAIEQAAGALRAAPGETAAQLLIGNLYAKSGDRRQAMAAYAALLARDPEFAPALYAQGALLEQDGRLREAAARYREALLKAEDFLPALNNLACLELEQPATARDALRLAFQAYRLEPANPLVMDTLGWALCRNGRGGEALKLLEKAAALLPANPSVAAHLALARQAGAGNSGKPVRLSQR